MRTRAVVPQRALLRLEVEASLLHKPLRTPLLFRLIFGGLEVFLPLLVLLLPYVFASLHEQFGIALNHSHTHFGGRQLPGLNFMLLALAKPPTKLDRTGKT